jgi:hypothetical protein
MKNKNLKAFYDLIIVTIYLAVGIYLAFIKYSSDNGLNLMKMLGILIILYGIFRAYRIYRMNFTGINEGDGNEN